MEAWREELYHHGIKGQRWGVRRYQNKDGSRINSGQKKKKSIMPSLMKKQEYYKPKDFKDAQKRIQKKALISAATVAIVQPAVQLYLKKRFDMDISYKSMAKTTAVYTGLIYVSNVLYDEVGYAATGKIRK